MAKHAPRMELASFAGRIEVKAAPDAEEGTFSGYGTVFGNPHPTSSPWLPADWKDVFVPGAFARTLAEHKANGTMPAMFMQHDMHRPIGAWAQVAEDDKGLAVSGRLATKTRDGGEAYELIRIGALGGLSVGFNASEEGKHFTLDRETKTRFLREVELPEISPVAIAGNPKARIGDVKAGEGLFGNEMQSRCLKLARECLSLMGCDEEQDPEDDGEESKVAAKLRDLVSFLGGDEARLGEAKGAPTKMEPDGEHSRPGKTFPISHLEMALRDAGLSRREAKAVLSRGFSALRDAAAADELSAMEKLTAAITGET